MAAVIPNEGEIAELESLLKSKDRVLHLFKNNVTPDAASTVATFTECAFTGYAAITLVAANWPTPTTNGTTGKAESTYAEQSFTVTTADGESYYGYYITDAAGTKLLRAERFADAPCALADGNVEKITVTYTGTSEA